MMFEYLQDKKIVVTGSSGFLGRFVMQKLQKYLGKGSKIIGLRSKDYDLRIPDKAFELVRNHKPDIVINLAARLGGIGDNRSYPASYFYDNLMIGINMIDACRLFDVNKLVNIGTVCSYPKNAPVPFKEENLWDGFPEETNGPYGISKRAAIVYSQAVKKQYGFTSVNIILTNLYGPGDDFREDTSHVIPAIIKKVVHAKEKGEPSITAWGDGSPSRDFLFIDDAAEAVIRAAEFAREPDPINIGSGEEVRIKFLIEKIVELLGYKGKIIWDTTKPNGQPRRYLDTSKAKKILLFEARKDFIEGLKETIGYYLSNREVIEKQPSKFSDFSPYDSLFNNRN